MISPTTIAYPVHDSYLDSKKGIALVLTLLAPLFSHGTCSHVKRSVLSEQIHKNVLLETFIRQGHDAI
jgi:hypothetical protein